MATYSWDYREEICCLWNRFAIFKTISEGAQSKSLDARHRFIARSAVDHDSGKFGNLSDPPTIFLLFSLDSQVNSHEYILAQTATYAHSRSPNGGCGRRGPSAH